MTHQPKVVTITDPRTFDGTPYDVADRAVGQVIGLLSAALDVMPETRKMVLNAELDAQIAIGQDPNPAGSNLVPKILEAEKELAAIRKRLEIVQRAAAYDPRHPPRA